ncbi:MAG: hypothetical protein GY796_37225 [Chloroflexi bacterium]|nr:hypothetical protein [Chloroflexota bacterium]
MSGDLLQTKLYVPRLRPFPIPRPHLTKQLNQGLQQGCKLILISAPAGFGKTTLISEWVDNLRLDATKKPKKKKKIQNRAAWLSLDEGDNDPTRFLTYFIAVLSEIPAVHPAQQYCGLIFFLQLL